MRSFTLTLLLLCGSGSALLVWARMGCEREPFLTDSRRLEWALPGASLCPEHPEPLANMQLTGTRAERIAAVRQRIRDLRFWGKNYFERYPTLFERVDCHAAVVRVEEPRIVVRVRTPHRAIERWYFCAQRGGDEYFCRIERRTGAELHGTIVEQGHRRNPADKRSGAVLLRPLYLSPPAPAHGDQLNTLMELAARLKVGLHPRIPHFPPGPNLEARVLEANGRVVVFSAGSKQGISVGTEFKLSRGVKFVGFVKVTRVFEHQAVGEFDTQFAGKGAPPRAGDRAYTGRRH